MGLQPSQKYEMRQRGCLVELLIHNLKLEDTGEYSCETGDQETKASLNVKGRWVRADSCSKRFHPTCKGTLLHT